MKIEHVPFAAIDWTNVQPVDHPGETGVATWRTIEVGNVRVRKVDYSAGYLADHWCSRGHVILVLEGGRVVERGRHGELLELGGRYAGLWAGQKRGTHHDEASDPADGQD